MTVTLTQQAEQIIRNVLIRHPEQSAEQIIEQALQAIDPEQAEFPTSRLWHTRDEFKNWLEQLRKNAESAPHMANETYSRDMIYRDHD